MSSPRQAKRGGVTWRMVGVLKRGQKPAQGNTAYTMSELAKMTGQKPPSARAAGCRIEYKRVRES